MGFGGRTRFHKNIIALQVGGGGGGITPEGVHDQKWSKSCIVQSWPPRESTPAEKTVHHPSGAITEAFRGSIWALDAQGKSILRRTSEMTPIGGVPFSLLAWIPSEARIAHRFHRKSPKSPKKCPKIGVPPFLAKFSGSSPLYRTPHRE